MVSEVEKRRREGIKKNHAHYWLGKARSTEDRKKFSDSAREPRRIAVAINNLPKYKKRESPLIGRLLSKETREKLSESHKGQIAWNKGLKGHLAGHKHYNWQGGLTPINKKIRNSFEYKSWRESVFRRDNYMCVWCGIRGQELNADHIKPFSYFPELRFELSNGRTLCVPCHSKTDTFKGRTRRLSPIVDSAT